MSIWISLLLAFLPKILEWILSLIRDNKQLTGGQLEKMNRITYYAAQIAEQSPKAGCAVGGVKPLMEGTADEAFTDEIDWPVSGRGIIGGWMDRLILDLIRQHGKELGLKVLKEVVLPWLKEKVTATPNKYDDYAVKQLERIVNDPEFIALMENVG